MHLDERMPTTTPLAVALRDRREQYASKRPDGKFSLTDLRDALIAEGIPKRYVPSVATLSRMETKGDESSVDAIVIYGMSLVYGCRVSDLSMEVADELDAMRDLLAHASPCITAADLVLTAN